MIQSRHGGLRWAQAGAGMLLALLSFLLLAPRAFAHAQLVQSEPADQSALSHSPQQVRLSFTEPLEPGFSYVRVYDSQREIVSRQPATVPATDPKVITAAVKTLPDGLYTVVWKVVSAADGHTSRGTQHFTVGAAAPQGMPEASAGAPEPLPEAPSWPGAAGRWMAWMGMVLVGSGPLFALLVLPQGPDAAPVHTAWQQRWLGWAWPGAALWWAGTVIALFWEVSGAAETPISGVLGSGALGTFLLHTRHGWLWLARLAAGAVLTAWLVLAARTAARAEVVPERCWGFGAAIAAAVLLAVSLASHAAATQGNRAVAVAADYVHVLATVLWVGGLSGLLLLWSGLRRVGIEEEPWITTTVKRFSRWAAASVALLAATGAYALFLHLGNPAHLLQSDYGRMLTAKLALLALMLALAAANRVRATLAKLRVEAVLGAGLLLAVSVLTILPPPSTAAGPAAGSASDGPYLNIQAAGDLMATLSISPLRYGTNTFEVELSAAGQPISDASLVRLQMTMPDMEMAPVTVEAKHQQGGRYTVTSDGLSMSGRWQIDLTVRRAGKEDVKATYTVDVPDRRR